MIHSEALCTTLHHRARGKSRSSAIRTADSRQQCEPATAATPTTRNSAAPPGRFRRAGHAAPCGMGHFAREKGNWAASLLPVPWVRSLPSAASARRKDCRPRGLDALMQAQRGSLTFFAPLDSQEHFKSRSPFKKDDAAMVRFTTRQSAVDELRRLVVDGIHRDHFLGPKNFRCRGQGTPPSGVPHCSGSYNFLKRLYPAVCQR